MRIISKFRDYYDSVQGVMYDSDIIYKRIISNNDTELELYHRYNSSYSNLNYIGFCNRVIPVFKYAIDLNQQFDSKNSIELYLKKSNKINKTFKSSVGRFNPDTYVTYDIEEAYQINTETQSYSLYNKQRKLSHFKSKIDEYRMKVLNENLFEKLETPIFCINPNQTTTAPILKDYHFQEIMGPYEAYQELVMWIGNQAVNEYPPQIIDDIVLRDKKGFDKWSFKTMPTKKRK